MKRSKKKETDLPMVSKQCRKFKKNSSISAVLKCSICMQVFHEPTRLFCGHTFCFECLQIWSKTNNSCPTCRERIDRSNIGKDLLAYHIINELEVFCVHQECSWEGTLEMLNLHVFYECFYNQIKPVAEKQKEEGWLGDEEVQDKINENVVRGTLLSRVLMKEDTNKSSRTFDVARRFIPKERRHSSELKESKEQNNSTGAKKGLQGTGDDFDFLMELYSNSH